MWPLAKCNIGQKGKIAKNNQDNNCIFYLCFDKERYLHKKTYKFAKTYQNQFSQIFWQARAEQLTERVAKIQAHIQRKGKPRII